MLYTAILNVTMSFVKQIQFVILIFALFSVDSLNAQSNNLLSENFSSGIPQLWQSTGVTATTNNGKTCVSMTSNAIIETPVVNKPGNISFSHRASGNGKTLTLQKSVNNADWVTVGSVSPGSASAWGSSSIFIGDGASEVRLRFVCSSATIYLTDIVLTPTPSPSLSVSPSELDFGTVFEDETSATLTVSVNGTYLSGDITVTTNVTEIELSNDGSLFDTSTKISQSSGMPATIWARYKSPETAIGQLYGNLIFSTPESTNAEVNISVTSSPKVPTVVTSPQKMTFGYVLYNNASDIKTLIIEGKYLEASTGILTISVGEQFQISLTENGNYTQFIQLPFYNNQLLPTTIYAKFTPTGTQHLKTHSAEMLIEGGGAQTTIEFTGIGVTLLDGLSRHYYISPLGNDANGTGTLANPWYSLAKAITYAQAGDTIHCRGGSYQYNQTIRLDNSGLPGKRIHIFAYKNDQGIYEQPVFDFKSQPYGASNRGILMKGSHWYLFGIHITKAGDNGIKVEGSYNIVERCVFSYCGDTGLQLGFGHNFSDSFPGISKNDGSYCAYNLIVDCDSFQNYDPDNRGSDADGFACKMHNGLENWFIRCRAWNNADDAWDLFETDFAVYLIECWGWHSGDASQHPVEGGSFQGNGNGIKLGGNGTGGSSKGKHEVWNSITFNNNKTNSVKGFDQNSHAGGVKLVNNLAFNNGYDYMFETAASGTTNEFYNNVCLSNRLEINTNATVMQNNVAINNPAKGWGNALTLSFSASDYFDLSESAAKLPRGVDGSLPTSFGRLKPGSQLIDKGLSQFTSPLPNFLGQPLVGSAITSTIMAIGTARDLGPYETETNTPTSMVIYPTHDEVMSLSVFQPRQSKLTFIQFVGGNSKYTEVVIFDISGRLVHTVFCGATETNRSYTVSLPNKQFSKGMYVCKIHSGEKSKTAKFTVASH